MLLNSDSGLASASNTSTNPTPVPPSAPVTIPVYPPGGRVIRIAASKAQLGGGPACPGLAVHGLNPVAVIAVAPSQTNPEQLGASCQLSFCAITVDPEKSCSNGLANVPSTKN